MIIKIEYSDLLYGYRYPLEVNQFHYLAHDFIQD